MLISDQLRFLEAVAQENRTSFGGWIKKADVQETLNILPSEADKLASDLVQLGYLQTQGFGNLNIKLSLEGQEHLARSGS